MSVRDGGPFASSNFLPDQKKKKKKLLILDGLQLPMTVGEIILKDVWSGFSVSGGSTAHPGGSGSRKKQLYSTFSPRETQINSF